MPPNHQHNKEHGEDDRANHGDSDNNLHSVGYSKAPSPSESSDSGWSIPGVVHTPHTSQPSPGTVEVSNYQPVTTPTTKQATDLINQCTNIDELITITHTALQQATQLAASQSPTPGILDHITRLTRITNTSQALTRELIYQTDQTGICQQVTRCGITSWLTLKTNLTRRQATQVVLDARHTARFGVLRQASLAGRVNPAQTTAITTVLKDLPSGLEPVQTLEAEQLLTGLAETCGSDVLSRASQEVLERVAPITAQDAMEAKAARNLQRASRTRYLNISTHPDGTTTINGLLPALEGELVRQVISQISEQHRRTQQARTPGVPPCSRRQAEADALTSICRHITNCNQPDVPAGAHTTVVVTIPIDQLPPGGLGRLTVDGQLLDTQTTNTLLCDTTIMRAVIGTKHQILDIGRTTRIIPAAIRTALTLRDKEAYAKLDL